MHEERLVVAGVPARLYTATSTAGLLLLGHGGGHSKDSARFVALSRHYASTTDLAVVCIDAVDHGERRPASATDGLPQAWHSRTTPQMVADWQAVAEGLSSIGPALAYVGFSMGALFGFATVASMPSVSAAVFVAAGFPTGGWTDDPDLRHDLASAASRLCHCHVLMLNKDEDEMFDPADAHALFDSVSADSKQLLVSQGRHDDWGPDLIAESVRFVNTHVLPATSAPSG